MTDKNDLRPMTEDELREIEARLDVIFTDTEESIEGEWGSGHIGDIIEARSHVRRVFAALRLARAENERIRNTLLTILPDGFKDIVDRSAIVVPDELRQQIGDVKAEFNALKAEGQGKLDEWMNVLEDGQAQRAIDAEIKANLQNPIGYIEGTPIYDPQQFLPFRVGQRVRVKAGYVEWWGNLPPDKRAPHARYQDGEVLKVIRSEYGYLRCADDHTSGLMSADWLEIMED